MKRTIDFGKIDLRGSGRKINKVTVDVELRTNRDGNAVFSCVGNVWNARGTDIIMGGQCLDDIAPHMKGNRTYAEVLDLWRKYHLNDMHAGSERQEACVKANPNRRNYKSDCAWLERWGLLWDEDYKYGTAWLYREIPTADYNRIAKIIIGGEAK